MAEKAKLMAPVLMQAMAFDAVDAVYTRWCATALRDPDLRSVQVTAHNLIATHADIQFELARARADEAKEKALRLQSEERKLAKSQRMKVTAISVLAARDGIALPYATRAPEKPQEGHGPGETYEGPSAADEAARMAQVERNRDVYLHMLAEYESRTASEKSKGGKR